MSTAYSYPGIYIQELPLSTQTITPAPTSITAFVGYTHPWKTAVPFGMAVQLFSFTDYETYFGGIYTSGLIDSDVARAVYAFFLNGGNNAYVVGLQPEALVGTSPATSAGQFGSDSGDFCFTASIVPDPGSPNVGMLFQALEPADVIAMTAKVSNLRQNPANLASPTAYTLFDLTIAYGTRIEVYRSVDLTIAQGNAKSLDKLINGNSNLVTVQPIGGATYGVSFPQSSATPPPPPTPPAKAVFTLGVSGGGSGLPAGFSGSFAAADFLPVFQPNSSLDTVEIFNLLLVPGVADNEVLSAALAFAERKRAFAILDPPPQATAFLIPKSNLPTIDSYMNPTTLVPVSQNGALYFP